MINYKIPLLEVALGHDEEAKGFRIGLLGWATIAATVVGLGPVAAVIASLAVTRVTGCVVNEGFAEPCMVAGFDISDALYTGFMMGWLFLLTLPVAVVAAVLWTMVVVRGWRRWHDRHRAAPRART